MRKLVVPALVGLWSGTAHAHLVTTGLGPVYDGVSHLFVSFDDLLPVVALAMLSGLNGPAAGRRALFTLPAAWLLAGVAGHWSATAVFPVWITAVSVLLMGVLTAADRRLNPRVVAALAGLLGAVHGWRNGTSLAIDGRGVTGLVGIAGAIFLLTALVGAAIVSLRPPWTRIALPAAGSWIAAIGLLYLGWALSGRL